MVGFSLDNLLGNSQCGGVQPGGKTLAAKSWLAAKSSEANDEAADGSYERYLCTGSAFDLGLSLFKEEQKACFENMES